MKPKVLGQSCRHVGQVLAIVCPLLVAQCSNEAPVGRDGGRDGAGASRDAGGDAITVEDTGRGDAADGDTAPGDGSPCPECVDSCDVDGDGRERIGRGCAGDDCDDGHPNCWDQAKHGCCRGDGLLFHSEFEGSVAIEVPEVPASQWRLPFVGKDGVTGYDWDADFPEDGAHVNVNLQARGTSTLIGDDPARIDDPDGERTGTTGLVDARVIEHPGIDGRRDNRVLFFHSWRDDSDWGSNSRLQANWFPPDSMNLQGGEIYVAHWLKLQPNLYRVHTAFADPKDWHSRWRNIGEWRHDQAGCADASFRFSLAMETYNSDFVYWSVGGSDCPWGDTTSGRADLAPPVDTWFFLEVYTKRHPSNGRLWVGVNGMTLFDQKGVQTMPKTTGCWTGNFGYQFLKLYGDLYNYEDRIQSARPPYQFWQYYDGLRIYDKLPAGHCALNSSCPAAKDLS